MLGLHCGRATAGRIALAVLAAAVNVMVPTSAWADSLVGVVAEALETHPELAAIRFNRHAIDNELNAARGLRLPTVDARGEYGEHKNRTVTGTGFEDNNDWHEHRSIGVHASQRLFDGFEARNEIERQRNRVESSRWRVNDTANSIALRAVQAYLEVMRARAVRLAAQSNLDSHNNLLRRVRARVDAGKANEAEASEAGARAANARVLLAEADARVLDAEALFRSAVGRAPGKLTPPTPPSRSLPPSVEVAVGEALEAAPSVIATQHDAMAAEAAVGSAYSRLYPKLNFELSTDHARGDIEEGDKTMDARAMLVVRWNLFNGGIDKARIWEARARASEAHAISANMQRIVERETRVSWHAMAAAGVRVPELRRQLDLNKSTRSAYMVQFDAGQRRLLDLLDIQAELFVTESTLRTEELVGAYNTYRVLAAMGRLVPALGLELPPEAVAPASPTLIDGWRTELQSRSASEAGWQPVTK